MAEEKFKAKFGADQLTVQFREFVKQREVM
jgi:hypothetical protein